MSYVVGDKECGCPNMAKQLAQDTGKMTEYVVAGERTCCDVTARLNLARAKYKAAVEVLVKADTKVATRSVALGLMFGSTAAGFCEPVRAKPLWW